MTGLRTMEPVALVETLAAVGKLNDEPPSRMAADKPNPSLVVGDMTMSSMIAPAAIRPKPRRATPSTRRPAALAAAHSAVTTSVVSSSATASMPSYSNGPMRQRQTVRVSRRRI